ncbi:MAG TPA: DUF3105 domain-containing protein [Nocardioidaceae bacterium]|nr:DUF3105 domain-containing protein [Nocardioidaceae bacterium]
MAKASKNQDRRAVLEQMRREQQAAEKKRTAMIIAGAGLVGLLIIGAAAYPLISDTLTQSELAKKELAALGASAEAAGCTDVQAKEATGSADHREPGSDLPYVDSPPATGPHYPTWADISRKFYTAQERPDLGLLVHNLEHGYNILWYDETIADDAEKVADVEAIARKFEGTDFEDKFIAAPWTAEDGEPFPDGAHVALTHWSMGGTNGNPEGQHGITQYCEAPSGEAVAEFVEQYPYTDSPEPGAM